MLPRQALWLNVVQAERVPETRAAAQRHVAPAGHSASRQDAHVPP